MVLPFLSITFKILCMVYASCVFGGLCSMWLCNVVLNVDDGTSEMRNISDPIREGAEGFLRVQYSVRFNLNVEIFNFFERQLQNLQDLLQY